MNRKNLIVFLSSQTLSLFGSSLVQYAIIWYITLNTSSGLMMTISIICGFLPAFLFSPFAGVLADRFDRKLIIAISDSVIAAATLILAILFMAGYRELWLIFLISAIRGLGTGVQTPAVGAFLPQIVSEKDLVRVGGINTTIQSAVMLIAPVVSGALLGLTNIEAIFLADVVTAAIAVVILLSMLKVPAAKADGKLSAQTYFEDFRVGLSYVKNHREIRFLFLFSAVLLFLVVPAAFLSPLQVNRSYAGGVWELTLIEIAFSGGMIIGGAVLAFYSGFKNKMGTLMLATVMSGLSTAALGAGINFKLYLICMFVSGLCVPVYNTLFTAFLQIKTKEDYLGRVFGLYGMISSSVMPAGMLLFGPLADHVKIETMLIVTGVLITAQTLMLLKEKTLFHSI